MRADVLSAAEVAQVKAAIGYERPIIGMHVRRGDACHTSLRKGRCEGATPHAAV